MFFKSLRTQFKSSSSQSTTTTTHPASMDVSRITSLTSSAPDDSASLAVPRPPVITLSTVCELDEKGTRRGRVPGEGDGSRDYEAFLEKARREDERSEMAKARVVMTARATNMSPWARRM